MKFNDLEQILCVAEERNISLAAKRLYMTQPSLSQTIKRVERQMGYMLFERVHSGLFPTREGERFVKIAQQIIELRDELTVKLKEAENDDTNRLIIGLPVHFSSGLLPDVLGKFCVRHPNVEISIKDAPSPQVEAMILNGEVDVAIVHQEISLNKIVQSVVSREKMLIAVSPNNKIASSRFAVGTPSKTIDLEELKRQTFILSNTNQWMRQFADEFFTVNNFQPRGLMFINSIETIKQLTLKNLGVSFIPTSYVQGESAEDSLVYFPIPGSALPKLTLSAAYLKANSKNKLISTFMELISSR
ncbi:MAG: LysR family transcriptional regulator [Synergistaceae bacterium]|jgi:DNA-binding transcriptional LysR family regulator|nr:LysR family transcriptional regulator [Synergistaceae bacterium]